MNILGLSTFADASAAIITNGKIVCAVEEERLNRQKHYYGTPWLAIKECLEIAQLTIDDIDFITVGWNPLKGWNTRIMETVKSAVINPKVTNKKISVGGSYISGCQKLFRLRKALQKTLFTNNTKQRIIFVDHHTAHAASAYYSSPYDSANIIVADGIGESATISLFTGHANRLKRTYQIKYPNSLGHVYASITGFLGYKMTHDEGTVMALASYGQDNYHDLFSKLVSYDPATCILRVNTSLLDYHGAKKGVFSKQWLNQTSLTPRKSGEPLCKRHEDLAHSLQKCIERTIISILQSHFPDRNTPLCAAGGLFLNSVLNGKIVRCFNKQFFIQPAAGDNGVSIGSALYASATLEPGYCKQIQFNTYLGREYDDSEILHVLNKMKISYTQCDDVYSIAADKLLSGKIIGWFRGRMEFGPRALGNRSILANAACPSTKEIINSKVKHREAFRPFACSLLEEDMGDFFEDIHNDQFMLKVFKFKGTMGLIYPAIRHIDNSCRIQTVSKKNNPDFYILLNEIKRRTGHSIILNTSLNNRGEPIVNTPYEAIKLMVNTNIDALFLNNYCIENELLTSEQ